MTRPRLPPTVGVVLAGGQSRRFGQEKAVANFRGRALMDAVADCLSGCASLAVSAKPHSQAAQRAREQGWAVLHDDAAHPSGPLSGVCAALKWADARGYAFLATAPCDAPLLPRTLFSSMHDALGDAPAVYAVTKNGEHPLCALWRVSLSRPLARLLDAGAHPSVRDFLHQHGARQLTFGRAERFANANTVNDLSALEGTQ